MSILEALRILKRKYKIRNLKWPDDRYIRMSESGQIYDEKSNPIHIQDFFLEPHEGWIVLIPENERPRE